MLADGLTRSLRQSGYAIDCVKNGQDADTALSTQEFDLTVKNEAGDIVYRWSAGRAFSQALHTLSVGPGEKNFTLQFQLLDAQRNPLPAGVSYTLQRGLAHHRRSPTLSGSSRL